MCAGMGPAQPTIPRVRGPRGTETLTSRPPPRGCQPQAGVPPGPAALGSARPLHTAIHTGWGRQGRVPEGGPWPQEPPSLPATMQVSTGQWAAHPPEWLASPRTSWRLLEVEGMGRLSTMPEPVQRGRFQTPQGILLGASVKAAARRLSPSPQGWGPQLHTNTQIYGPRPGKAR